MPVTASPVRNGFNFPSGSEVVRIEYELGRLSVFVRGFEKSHLIVIFADVEAFRVMDERDLSQYWPTCSTQNGWIFEIQDGGWLSQELDRPGSLIAHLNQNLREYLITGEDDCVSILSLSEPNIICQAIGTQNEA